MPPWNSLRLGRPSEKDLHARHSMDPAGTEPRTPTPSSQADAAQSESNGAAPVTLSPRRNRKMRDSVVSMGAIGGSHSTTPQPTSPPSVPLLELPEDNQATVRPHRFSLMRFRHASDSQLSKTAKEHGTSSPPPIPLAPPHIIRTAPTTDNLEVNKRRSTFSLHRPRRATTKKKSQESLHFNRDDQTTPVPSGRITFEGQDGANGLNVHTEPPPYGAEHHTLGLPIPRMSESSRSDASSNDHGIYAQTTTTHTVSTTTTFFRIPRRKKDKGPLFPLPPKTNSNLSSATNTPRMSSGRNSESPIRRSFAYTPESSGRPSGQDSPQPARALRRSSSRTSAHSQGSSLGRPKMLGQRGRSSTKSSLRRPAIEDDSLPTPPLPHSTRTSTSTSGRPSLGGLFGINRMKGGESHLGRGMRNGDPGTPASVGSKEFPFTAPKEPPIVIPQRQEGDTPAKYLARLEEVVNHGTLVTILSKSEDEFMRNVLRSYMRRFKFFEDPLDIAVRKLLMHVELPKETQQIDRTLQSFADRYYECNPGIFLSEDDAYFVAFSILLLHSDMFNKNNKHKMTKADYVKNARGQNDGQATCAPEVLECFYDNTAYTTFIHLEDEAHFSSERIMAQKQSRKGPLKVPSTPLRRSNSGPVDPYALILDNQLDTLRPTLDDVLVLEDSFNYLAPEGSFNVFELNKTFFRSGILQILSARSRPEAFANQATVMNPTDAQVGVVDIKVTKVGLLWRKDPKKKKTRSPWQEWGAVLTASQLYFFRNASWVKNLMHQFEHHQKAGRGNFPVVFKPPLEQFKPDFLVSMDHAVALTDSRYRKHKNAFLFTRHDTFSEVFLADNESERTDWLAKLNYAATYRTNGVRMRDVTSPSEGRRSRESTRPTSDASTTSGTEDGNSTHANPEELTQEQQITIARRQIIEQKLSEAKERIASIEKSIESFLRTGRHLKMLTPIQLRTRDDVICAAEHLSDTLRFTRIEQWRFKCHKAILSLDLDDDMRSQTDQDASIDGESKTSLTSPQNAKDTKEGRLPFARFNPKSGSGTGVGKLRPGNLPTGGKLFSMDEIFRTPSRLRAAGNHKSKGSWELPPINFDAAAAAAATASPRRKSSSRTRVPMDPAIDESAIEDSEADSLQVPSQKSHSLRRDSADGHLVSEPIDIGEHEVLVQAGVLTPTIEHTAASPTSPRFSRHSQALGEPEIQEDKSNDQIESGGLGPEDEARLADIDDNETRRKVRHSLQRKLQSQSGSSGSGTLHYGHNHQRHHSRSHSHSHAHRRRNRDSSSTIVPGDDSAAMSDGGGEMLARGAGSFTVHGKKASVVQFSGNWSNIGVKRVGTDPARPSSSSGAGLRASTQGRPHRHSMEIGRAVTTDALHILPARPSADGRPSVDDSVLSGDVMSGSETNEEATTPTELRSPISYRASEVGTLSSFKSARSSLDDQEIEWDRGRERTSTDLGDEEISPRGTRTNTMDEIVGEGNEGLKGDSEKEEKGKEQAKDKDEDEERPA